MHLKRTMQNLPNELSRNTVRSTFNQPNFIIGGLCLLICVRALILLTPLFSLKKTKLILDVTNPKSLVTGTCFEDFPNLVYLFEKNWLFLQLMKIDFL